MPSIQDTVYPHLKKHIKEQELEKIYTSSKEEISLTFSVAKRTIVARLCFLIMLKTFQRLGYFVYIGSAGAFKQEVTVWGANV